MRWWHLYRNEWIKARGTFMFWLTLGGTALLPILYALIIIFNSASFIPSDSESAYAPWDKFFTNTITAIALFLVPIFAALLVSLSFYVEEKSNTWKHILVQPTGRVSFLMAKVAFLVSNLAIAYALLLLFIISAAIVTGLVVPDLQYFHYPIPLHAFGLTIFYLWVASLGMVGIHLMLSLRFTGYIVPVAIGVAGSLINMMAVSWEKLYIFPYAGPFTQLAIENAARDIPYWAGLPAHLFISLSIFLCSLVLGAIMVRRRQVL